MGLKHKRCLAILIRTLHLRKIDVCNESPDCHRLLVYQGSHLNIIKTLHNVCVDSDANAAGRLSVG